MTNKIYADYAATTPLDKRVLEAMLPFLGGSFHNPSAHYPEARAVRAMIEKARGDLLDLLEGDPGGRVIFTGSGTEGANLALHSAITGLSPEGGLRILISSVEHHAVLNYALSLAEKGFMVTCLPVDRHGIVAPETLKKHMGQDVRLVSIMTVNNETGAINNTAELCKIAHDGGALFHTDAVQALGVMPVQARYTGADYISVSAHKIYGPKGIGALYAAPGKPISPLILGGKQEDGARAGTENTAGIAGFGCAAGILQKCIEGEKPRLASLKKIFLEGIAEIPDIIINSPPDGAPHIINISIKGIEAEPCLLHLSMAGILASMGAACNATSIEPSHVIEAIGVPAEYKRGTLRFSFGRDTTAEDAEQTAEELAKIIARLR